ncbi:hypothetical protein AGMMS49928_11500 [Spirochaetia bacterium]|nr:hypothetical protein AGMMS49928_11500 [Spirochaetia bacterium]
MNKVIDFYKNAESNPALRADLEAAKKRYEGQIPGKETIVSEGIAIAAKYGVILEPADFESAFAKGELTEEELEAVAGGFVAPLLMLIANIFAEIVAPAVGATVAAC